MGKTRRVTMGDLEFIAKRMRDAGMDIAIDWSYGQPRIGNKELNRYWSYRDTKTRVQDFLLAYEQGWHASRAEVEGGDAWAAEG